MRTHLISALICHLAFAIPSLLLLVALSLIELEPAIFLFVFFFLTSPIAGLITWLIDRGSRGENALIGMKALGVMPGRLYGFLIGGMLGHHLGGLVGGIICAILFYLLWRLIGFRLGSSLSIYLAEYYQ